MRRLGRQIPPRLQRRAITSQTQAKRQALIPVIPAICCRGSPCCLSAAVQLLEQRLSAERENTTDKRTAYPMRRLPEMVAAVIFWPTEPLRIFYFLENRPKSQLANECSARYSIFSCRSRVHGLAGNRDRPALESPAKRPPCVTGQEKRQAHLLQYLPCLCGGGDGFRPHARLLLRAR